MGDCTHSEAHELETLRCRMVDEQLIRRGIRDPRVLDAMGRLERHRFVPPHRRMHAYGDHPLAIGSGQTISQPYMVALMTELLTLRDSEKVLEIGTGSGYQTALLAMLVRKVVSTERVGSLSEKASERLEELGLTNIILHQSDGTLGCPEEAPFDRILVTAAAPHPPSALLDQLAVDGILEIPIGSRDHQVLTCITRSEDGFSSSESVSCIFVPLIGEDGFSS